MPSLGRQWCSLLDLRDAGLDPFHRMRQAPLIDPHVEKMEELVGDSNGKILADVVHDRLRAIGFDGYQTTARRPVAGRGRPGETDGVEERSAALGRVLPPTQG